MLYLRNPLVRISSIYVENFRNLAAQEITFSNLVTIVTGENGQGKTSLIEAIYLLAQPRSFRGAKPRELVRWSSADGKRSKCKVRAVIEASVGSREVAFEIVGGKRVVYLNGRKLEKATAFFGQVIAVEFNPDELQILKGGPLLRRRFLDKFIAMTDPAYAESLALYTRALKNRNALLANRNQTQDEHLSVWNEPLIQYGRLVAAKRAGAAVKLEQYAASLYSAISGKAQQQIRLRYRSDLIGAEGELLEAEAVLRKISESAPQERRRGVTMIGVHRDELAVEHASVSDNFKGLEHGGASQGQIRSITLAMKLAAVEYIRRATGEEPVLLLDDVDSELDSARRKELFQLIVNTGCQVLLTTTRISDRSEYELFGWVFGVICLRWDYFVIIRIPALVSQAFISSISLIWLSEIIPLSLSRIRCL